MGALLLLLDLVEPLQDLDLTLLKSLLLVLELVLKALHRVVLPTGDMPAFVDVAETAATDKLILLVFAKKNGLALWRGAECVSMRLL